MSTATASTLRSPALAPPKVSRAVTNYVSGYRFPVFYRCCICIPLKAAVILIAAWGIVPTVVCLLLSSSYAKELFVRNGVQKDDADAIAVFYGVLGVMVFTFHILLLIADLTRVPRFYIAYLAFILFYFIVHFLLITVICFEALRFRNIEFGIACLLLGLCNEIMYLYFWLIVQSKLQVTKCEQNVTHINITLV